MVFQSLLQNSAAALSRLFRRQTLGADHHFIYSSSLSARSSASSGRRSARASTLSRIGRCMSSPALAFTIYGMVERALIPFGLHHVWNVPFFFQAGEYTDPATGKCRARRNRALHRRRSDRRTHDRRLSFQNVGTAGGGDRDVARGPSGKPRQGRRHHDFGGDHFVPHRHHRADRVRVPLCRAGALRHPRAARRARLISLCIALGIKHGFTFSHGFIDYVVLFPKSHNALWLFVLGPIWAAFVLRRLHGRDSRLQSRDARPRSGR